jgi:hypothetical protein
MFSIEWWRRCGGFVSACRSSTKALEEAGISYAVVGEVAVAAWIARVDPAAVRNPVAIELAVHRSDFAKIKPVLESAERRRSISPA